MMQTSGPTKALAGIRVLDFSAMIAGPYCTRWLADLGANVIKVEPPEGDHMRHRPPLRNGQSTYFGHLNGGKRCIALNLKHQTGRELALRLAAGADVVVEAFRPGVMSSLGLGSSELRAKYPRLCMPLAASILHSAATLMGGHSVPRFLWQTCSQQCSLLCPFRRHFSIGSLLVKEARSTSISWTAS